jgi:deazaflavin-dependent oxidoreductase (nitroreductase family)
MPLRYVDPHRKRGRFYEANVRFGRSRPGQFLARHLAPRVDPWLHRTTAGRLNMGSNYGGPKHPQWYYNLKAHPDCEFGGESFVATQVTDADEYRRLYALAEHVYAGYRDYRAKTAPVGRQIPLFRLSSR